MDKLAQELNEFHSQGKRYTYYPPVSTWKESSQVDIQFEQEHGWSLYIHLPFCRELCTFCGCNIKITKNEQDHIDYVDALISEYRAMNFSRPDGPFTLIIGGGSPNILGLKAWNKLAQFIGEEFPTPADSLCEIDPRSFNHSQARMFFELGIKRFSFGVQDFDQTVLNNVNRSQSLDQLQRTASIIRDESETNFGIDLLWGMPLQERDPFKFWQEGLDLLKPDWINYYPLAKVPWLDSVQSAYGDFTLPAQLRKYELYTEGSKIFEENEYTSIGMGHFLHRSSELYQRFNEKKLFRSVSGLFSHEQEQVLGLGVSAISSSKKSLWQNHKIIDRYLHSIRKQMSPIVKVHHKTEEDIQMARLIDDVILERAEVTYSGELLPQDWFNEPHSEGVRSISTKGRHFKKFILQTLENNLINNRPITGP